MAAPIDLSAETSLEKQFFRCANAMQEAEKAVGGDNPPNQIQVTIDSDDNAISISSNMDAEFSSVTGKLEVVAKDYIA